MKANFYQTVLFFYFLFLVIFWMFLYASGTKTDFLNYLYSFLFGLIPLIGGFFCMINAKIWGGMKSSIGKAVFFLGLGLFLWGAGETIWSYYNFFLNEPAPYPSIADLGFAPSIFFYGLGAIYLSQATGAKFGFKSLTAKLLTAILSIGLFFFSYYVLVTIARAGVIVPEDEPILKAILDIAYPLGDFLAFVISAVVSGLSFKYLGGRYKIDTYSILLGLFVMFIADSVFSYTTTIGTFYNGSSGDLMLTVGLFLITFGALGFNTKPNVTETN